MRAAALLAVGLLAHLLRPSGLAAQDDGVTAQLWAVFHQAWRPRGNWQSGGTTGLRLDVADPSGYTRIEAGGGTRYLFNRSIDARGGLRLFYTFTTGANQFEVRPWQGAQFIWPRFKRFDLRQLVRLEERFVVQSGSSPSVSVRLRYRISTVIPVGQLLEKVTGYNRVSIPLSGEAFISNPDDISEPFASTVRLSAGIAYIANQDWSGDASLVFELSRNTQSAGDFHTSTIMLRFDVRHNRPIIAQ